MSVVDPTATLADLAKIEKNIRFGVARGLTQTAQQAQKDLVTSASSVFDRPTRATLNGFYIQPAMRDRLEAEVGIKDELAGFAKGTPASKFLAPQVFGGGRRQKRSERALSSIGLMGNKGFLVPGSGMKLNAHGNIPGSTMIRILSDLKAAETVAGYAMNRTAASVKRNKNYRRERYFVPKAGSALTPGVYRRRGRKIAPVLIFVAEVSYTPRFDFFGIVARSVGLHGSRLIQASIEQALATMR
ncbi:hypothetical protein FHS85_001762 [Rhodoligotrophos appendicifer]|uniref:hypothetical protein n=1 Tax=Rhodoligotrophos appendicifer TaxID=987056 RepID=UPI001185BE52|nr:hypothetical protein [Rhodoligotrophos appendicifer]